MSHHLKRHRIHLQPRAGKVFIEDTWHKSIGADLCLGRSRSGNLDPKNIRANLIRNSCHKIGRRQQAILEREFGLNYGLSPFEVRRARLLNNFLIKFVLVFFDNTHIKIPLNKEKKLLCFRNLT